MSQEELQKQIESLNTENANLNAQVAQNAKGIEGMLAQLDAHKASLNEAVSLGLQLRTNWILTQKQNQKLNENIQSMQQTIDDLNKQLTEAKKAVPVKLEN